MPRLHYLAYGSNLYPARLAARIEVLDIRGVVVLPDEALEFRKRGADGSAKCTLTARRGATAYAAVYAIAAQAKPVLDRIEGVGHGYRVEWREQWPHGVCFVYVAEDAAVSDGLLPFDWYKAYVVAGARYHAFPSHYVAALDAVVAQPDPDRQRASEHLASLT